MGYNSHTVTFLRRATRIVAAICIVCWIIASGIVFVTAPDLTSRSPADLIQSLTPPIILYLVPGVILLMLASLVKSERLVAAPLILLIGGLSLFKLVLLATSLKGPYFAPPLSSELPARIAAALLSVACVYAWEDLSDLSRNRPRAGAKTVTMEPLTKVHAPKRRVPLSPLPAPTKQKATQQQSPPLKPQSPKPEPPKPPPPSTSIPRPRLRRDEPPPSHTPWS
jgi:hypothetical protein